MTSHLDYFSDLIEDGEQIRSTVAGPGGQDDQVDAWYQLATTDARVLAIKLQKNTLGTYQPVRRMAAHKAAVHISRFASTPDSPARIELTGLDTPVSIVDIDRPDIFPLVEPFIVSWGGRLGGDGTHKPSVHLHDVSTRLDKRFALVAAGLLSVTLFFCACAGVLGGLIASTQGTE